MSRSDGERLPDAAPTAFPTPQHRHRAGANGSAASRGRRPGGATLGLLWIILGTDLFLLGYVLASRAG